MKMRLPNYSFVRSAERVEIALEATVYWPPYEIFMGSIDVGEQP